MRTRRSEAPVLGVFGGAFDPPHLGHALVPAYLRMRGLADRVLVAPCASHPLGKDLSPFARRMAWVQAAMATHGDGVEVSDIEQRLYDEHGGPSYTLRMLEAVAREHPQMTVRLVVGSDIEGQTQRWHRWDEIERRFPPIVVPRAGHASQACALPEISSTEVRAWRADGGPEALAHLRAALPAAVFEMLQAPPGRRLWIVGRGHVAGHAIPWLSAQGHQVRSIGGRSLVADPDQELGPDPDAIWVLVRDPAITEVAQALARRSMLASVPVLHGAGAHRAADVLAPLVAKGHPVGTLHPICSLRKERPGASHLAQAAFGIEGDAPARQAALAWVDAQPWVDLQDLDLAGRRAYHAACALVANHLAVPYAAARSVLEGQGHAREPVEAALSTLLRSSLDNLLALGLPTGITGPVSRGDIAAVRAHLEALPADAAALYRSLSERLQVLVEAHPKASSTHET